MLHGQNNNVLKIPEVVKRTGLSRATIYNYMAADLFPRPRKLGPRRVGWLEREIETWIAERPAA
jgi:prophage regulatory protein